MSSPVYSVQQLIADDSFLAYVHRTNLQAIERWESRLAQHPEQQGIIEEAVRLVQWTAMKLEPLLDSVIEEEALKLEIRLMDPSSGQHDSNPPTYQKEGRQLSGTPWRRMAASVVLLTAMAVAAWFSLGRSRGQIHQTAAAESKVIVLPDSSVVFLGESSRLRFDKTWREQSTREVWLEGEAFFHVKPKAVPGGVKFRVHAANTLVEVLGTRFNVWNRNSKPRVVLSSGKVKVNLESKPDHPAVYMLPGEMVELKENGSRLVKTQVVLQSHPPQKGHKIVFDQTPVRDIALVMEEYYGLKARWQEPSIADLRITGTLPTNNEASFLKALSVTLNVTIVRQANKQVLFKYNR